MPSAGPFRRDVGLPRLEHRDAQVDLHLAVALEGRLEVEFGQRPVLGDLDQRAVAEPAL